MFGLSEYTLASLYVIAVDLILGGFLLETLRRGGISGRNRAVIGTIFLAWISFLFWCLSTTGLFLNQISNLAFFMVFTGLVCFVCLPMISVPMLRNVLLKLTHDALLLPHGLRVFFGAGFLVEGVLGFVPKYFSILDGLFDITAGFLALKTGLRVGRGGNVVSEVWFANIFGLLASVVVVLSISFVLLKGVSPNHNVMYAAFFAAPILVGLHFISLVKLAVSCSSITEESVLTAKLTSRET